MGGERSLTNSFPNNSNSADIWNCVLVEENKKWIHIQNAFSEGRGIIVGWISGYSTQLLLWHVRAGIIYGLHNIFF